MIDPVSLIVTALALGAAAGLKPTAEEAVKDAYQGLKTLIVNRYQSMRPGVELVEQDPKSDAFKNAAQEMLEQTKAIQDEEVIQQVKRVLQAVEQHEPELPSAYGIDLEEVKAGASISIKDIVAEGLALRMRKVEAKEGDIAVENIRSGQTDPKD